MSTTEPYAGNQAYELLAAWKSRPSKRELFEVTNADIRRMSATDLDLRILAIQRFAYRNLGTEDRITAREWRQVDRMRNALARKQQNSGLTGKSPVIVPVTVKGK
jgi:hypothetical protein